MTDSLSKYISTYGADPEFFVYDTNLKEHISPHEITEGTKDEPEPIRYQGREWGIQIDGLALEINTPTYKNIVNLFLSTKDFLVDVLTPLMQSRTNNPNLKLSRHIANVFSPEVWQDVPEYNKRLGCSPDFDALKYGEVNPTPEPENPRFRTTAGHIAFGFVGAYQRDEPVNHMEGSAFVRNLLLQGVHKRLTSYVFRRQEVERRKLYGDIGAFRPKKFGVEWRAPSNMWCHSPKRALGRLDWSNVMFEEDALVKRIER